MPTSLYHWEAKVGTPGSTNAPDGGYDAGTNFPEHYIDFAVNEKLYYKARIPQSYTNGGNVDMIIEWVPPAGTSGSATFGGKFLGLEDGETRDSALSAQQTQADAVQSVGDHQVCTISFTSPSLVKGDSFIFELELTSALTGGNTRVIGLELQEQ